MTKLNIKGIKIYAFHGHFEEEKKLGGHFIVNLEIGFNSDKVVSWYTTHSLEDIINISGDYNDQKKIREIK